jgi:hypothetical protein
MIGRSPSAKINATGARVVVPSAGLRYDAAPIASCRTRGE